MRSTLAQLEHLTNKLEAADLRLTKEMLRNITDTVGIAMWAKDAKNHFVYANKCCTEQILHCSEDEAVSFTDADFENDDLAWACQVSDQKIQDSHEPMRFVEHNGAWWDTLKVPWKRNDVVVGTIGTARNITDTIPSAVKEEYNETASIPIPLGVEICPENIRRLLDNDQSEDKRCI